MTTRSRALAFHHHNKKRKQQEQNKIDSIVNQLRDVNYNNHNNDNSEWTHFDSVSSSDNAITSTRENVVDDNGGNYDYDGNNNVVVDDHNDDDDDDDDDEKLQAENDDYNNEPESDNDDIDKSDKMPLIAINDDNTSTNYEGDNTFYSSTNDEGNANYNMLLNLLTRVYDINIVAISFDKLQSVLDSVPPNDSNNIILNEAHLSKCDVSKLIHTFSINSKLTKKSQSELLGLLYTLMPNIDLPLYVSKNNKVISKVPNYVKEDYRVLSFDICPKSNHNCLVFAGDYANAFQCKFCFSNRYHKCHKCHLNECNHPNRVPIQRVYYRPLTLLLYDLLKYDEALLNMINYECEEFKKYEVTDVRNGENFKRHMKEMETKYQNYQNQSNEQYKMVNLCISQFYDGTMTRKSKVQTFWPLLITILNFPPDVRNKLGK
jgi:hypothetical protein